MCERRRWEWTSFLIEYSTKEGHCPSNVSSLCPNSFEGIPLPSGVRSSKDEGVRNQTVS